MRKLAQRFKEPSSWAGIAALLSILAPVLHLPVGSVDLLVQVGAGVAGLAAIALPERG